MFAYATLRDHEKIGAMIDRLDGTGRQFEVIWLRRLPADAVAATIHDLMVGKEEEKDDNRRSYFSYYSRSRDREEEQPNKGFRVDADIENNRLLLWANDAELEEVNKFLVKLGEIPGESGNPNTVRILDARGDEATVRLLEQIRQAWPSVAPNELRIQGAPAPPAEEDSPDHEPQPPEDESAAKFDSRARMGAGTRSGAERESTSGNVRVGAGHAAGPAPPRAVLLRRESTAARWCGEIKHPTSTEWPTPTIAASDDNA